MITDSFDDKTPAKISPMIKENRPKADALIVTFSHVIRDNAIKSFDCERIAYLYSATGAEPLYIIKHGGKRFAFFMTYIGAPAAVATIEDTLAEVETDKYIVFGGCGCLDREIARGKVIVPSEAYRDEGTSYHYAPAADYIRLKNSETVAAFMKESKLPFVVGKTWTTDSFYRETEGNIQKRKADGCIAVEMECAAIEAMCRFRGLNLYMFLTSGDLLDAPEWDMRIKEGQRNGTQHDTGHFDIALALADYVSK